MQLTLASPKTAAVKNGIENPHKSRRCGNLGAEISQAELCLQIRSFQFMSHKYIRNLETQKAKTVRTDALSTTALTPSTNIKTEELHIVFPTSMKKLPYHFFQNAFRYFVNADLLHITCPMFVGQKSIDRINHTCIINVMAMNELQAETQVAA